MYGHIFVVTKPKALGLNPSTYEPMGHGHSEPPLDKFRKAIAGSKMPWLNVANNNRRDDSVRRDPSGDLVIRVDMAIDPRTEKLFAEYRLNGIEVDSVELNAWVYVMVDTEQALQAGTWASEDRKSGARIRPRSTMSACASASTRTRWFRRARCCWVCSRAICGRTSPT